MPWHGPYSVIEVADSVTRCVFLASLLVVAAPGRPTKGIDGVHWSTGVGRSGLSSLASVISFGISLLRVTSVALGLPRPALVGKVSQFTNPCSKDDT